MHNNGHQRITSSSLFMTRILIFDFLIPLSAHQYLSRAGAHSAAAHLRLLESKHVLQFFVCKRSPESQGDNLFITHLFEGQC